ncbi:hypothetical protein Taro_034960 [Colocasia esculenta]|uniref:Uncharacterized protein n=1 Tax=Colocasia esculenta TaxID=4460 RepID=A0A843WBP8_COLES|nr:hypothetical protein [Colocasia esculenta]
MEYGSSSRAGADLTSEVGFIEPSSHCPFPEAVATGYDDSASAYAEYKAFAEQYPFTPVDAYIPRPAEEYPATKLASLGGQPFCDQLLSWGVMDSYSIPETSSPFLSWDGLGSPFFTSQAYSAFQVGDIADGDGLFGQTSYNLEPSIPPIDGGGLGLPAIDYPPAFQEFYAEESSSVQPSAPEAEAEERHFSPSNPPQLDFDDGGSPPLGLDALSGHGVEWPTRDQPDPGVDDDDPWDFLLSRVRAVVDSEDPPPIEAVKRALREKTMLAFDSGIAQDRWMAFVRDIWDEGDLCSLASDANKLRSRIAEARKGRKTQKLKITAEMENIVRLQHELEEARSSLEQEVKDNTKDSKEEAAFIKDDEEHRRSTSSKTKEVEQLKRKKPS